MAAHARYLEHVERLTAAIAAGELASGARLPPQREYADAHGLATSTVTRVYAELARRGLAVGEVGRGTFVRSPAVGAAAAFAQWAPAPGAVGGVDLAFNYPVLPEQTDVFRQALRETAAGGDLNALLAHAPHDGHPADRRAAAQWLSRRDGAAVSPEALVVCAGGQHALDVVQLALCRAGEPVGVEALTYPGWKALAALRDIPLVALGMAPGGSGIDPSALDRLCRTHAGRLRVVYTMPTLHNPLGDVMPLEQRQALVAVARRHDLLLVEDSAYGFLVADAPPPLRTLAPERTFEVCSLSKPAAPGLRIAYLIAPPDFAPRVHAAMRASVWSAAPLMAQLASRWLGDGTLDGWIARKREMAARRQAIARVCLDGLGSTGYAGAFHRLLPVPAHVRCDDVVAALHARGIAITPVDAFAAPGQAAPAALRIAFGSPASDAALEAALRQVAEVMRSLAQAR
ncbi:PLP-dependent aminotransferase family protein [Pandoraea nosoerga]|uniref:2-aminoadipate transaminase n=1 Tax=Pandoraea nosoerga TaxID=2508296 RepID=A0A5E4UC38_9BURK|nr:MULTISPECIES: PLP-dependent aminotransferase family protein [Pandoraea]MBN4667109.1 PLP-dependent aminotransferase family protein [Pandoraea nosoerga]MBN4677098.1 PLP-dependent aminotransferase family protein [Pandoraea nosoerga]MBN4681866.1 PLP-dependent aminotransferase family protein [Pandoraea nosoerga]MBN4746214.1 PLP-dependent aminotransferase family protein [Pandoraea nosoerga]VVD97371.1 2-aminoadipate transaminase [Pandoraea nosoerga]